MIVNETRNSAGLVLERVAIDLAGNRYRRWVDSNGALVLIDDRGLTSDEIAELTLRQNTDTIEQRLRDALAANKVFLALATPTNAQYFAQIRALTRQVSALIRKAADDYRDIET